MRRLFTLSTALLPLLLTAACHGAPPAPDEPVLAGTSWELVAIQPQDPAQQEIRIDDPARFTLQFGADGRAVLRLDCNRGNGAWQAQPASAGVGPLRFGPIATTRALCAPPYLDERVACDLFAVRAYRLIADRLTLSPTNEGGVLQWRRRAAP